MTLPHLAGAWTLGIVLASWAGLPLPFWLAALAFPSVALLLWWRNPPLRLFHAMLLCVVLGAVRYQLAQPSPAELALARFNDQASIGLIGIVDGEPLPNEGRLNLVLDTSRVRTSAGWEDISGRALVSAERDAAVRYGDQIQVEGIPTTPPGGADFSYRDFLARQSILTLLRPTRLTVLTHDRGSAFFAALYAVKGQALAAINSLFPEPSASFIAGVLLGRDEEISDEIQDAFRATGTGHIVAISGFNIAILAAFLGRGARRILPRRLADWFIIAALVLYTLLVGASASVLRAAIMGILTVIALHYLRQPWVIATLAASAVVMTILNPYAIWDLGFQLSFLATLGLVLYSNRISAAAERLLSRVARPHAKQIIGFLQDSLLVTLAAWVTTTPLLIAVFHRLSVVGLVTNLLILPAQPAVMILSGIAVLVQLLSLGLQAVPLAGVLVQSAAQIVAAGAWVFAQYTLLIVQWTASLPLAYIDTPRLDWTLAALLYGGLALATRHSLGAALRWPFASPARLTAVLAAAVVLVFGTLMAGPDGRTHVQFIAADGGQAALVQTARGTRILIDGTTEPSALLAHLGGQTTFLDRRIDLLVLTSLQDENVASLNAVLDRYDVARVIEPAPPDRQPTGYKTWRSNLRTKEIVTTFAQEGVRAAVDEVTLEVLAPGEITDGSVALRVGLPGQSLVWLPALGSKEQSALVEGGADLHGSVAVLPVSFRQDLLDQIRPDLVVLFAGRRLAEQPTAATLEHLSLLNRLRTDERGDIELILDGESLEVRTER